MTLSAGVYVALHYTQEHYWNKLVPLAGLVELASTGTTQLHPGMALTSEDRPPVFTESHTIRTNIQSRHCITQKFFELIHMSG